MTVPEKRDLVAQNNKIEFFMLVGRFNPPLCGAKILKVKTLYAWRDGRPNLPYSSRAIGSKKRENVNLNTTSGVIDISVYLTTSSIYAIPVSSRF